LTALDRKDQKMPTKQRVTLNTIADLLVKQNERIEALEELTTKPTTKAKVSRKTAPRVKKAPAKEQITRWFKQGKNGKWTETKDGSSEQFQKDNAAGITLAMFNSKTKQLRVWNSDGALPEA